MLDIESLRIIWWVLLGTLFIGFAITDGFDLGAAILFPWVAHNEAEKKQVLNAIGPFWEGNQVWIILGAGAIFAAWPYVYAVAFSGFYLLILLLLLTLGISRPVSFKYRDKLPNTLWRNTWDKIVFVGGFFPALIFGLLVGNVLTGAPFYFDSDLRVFYSGSFLELFHPFAFWCAFTSLNLLTMHGGVYLSLKLDEPIKHRAANAAKFSAVLLIVCFAVGGWWVSHYILGYEVKSGVDPYGFSNPLHKEVTLQLGAWMENYQRYPYACLAPLLGFLGALGVFFSVGWKNVYIAFLSSSLSIFGVISTVGVSMFPFILPSSMHFSSSLLVWDASSSELTLLMMLFAVIIFLPLVLLYTSWVYHALSGRTHLKLTEQKKSSTSAY